MQNKSVKDALKDLHDRYVITPIEMTNGNVALTCQKFNTLTLLRELGIANSQSTNTNEHCKNINYKNPDDFFRYLGMSISEDNKRLASISWLTELYMNTAKVKFIVSAPAGKMMLEYQ